MGATAIVVILLFLSTIISTSRDVNYSARNNTENPVQVTSQADYGMLPGANYNDSLDQNTQAAITRYVTSHAKRISRDEMDELVSSLMNYSNQYNINPKLVAALIARESEFDPASVSSSGALGLAQLLPSTAQGIGIHDPQDLDEGVKGACLYLKTMLDRWIGYPQQVPLGLASYTEGYTSVKNANGNYSAKTAGYIRDIMTNYYSMN